MADPFESFSDAGTEGLQSDEFYKGLSFLGKPTDITLPGQEPSPPGGALSAGGAAPAVSSPTGLPGSTFGSTPAGLPSQGLPPGLQALMTGAGFAERGSNVLNNLLSGGAPFPAGATETPGGALTTGAPEILRGLQFPDFPASAVTDFPGIGIEAAAGTGGEAAGSAGGAAGEAAGAGLGSLAGTALPLAGAAVGDIMTLLSNKSAGEKATDVGLTTAGAIIDALGGYGLGSLGAFALEYLLSGLFKPGPYIPKRIEAGKAASEDIQGLESGFQTAAQAVEGGGGLGPALSALEGTSRDVSATPGRNPVRSEVWLPPDVAQQFGVSGPLANNMMRVPWQAFSPDQFGSFLQAYAADPTTYGGYVHGSGDVAYLPQSDAERVAQTAQQETNAFLTALAGQRNAPASAAPPAVTAAAPAGGPFDVPAPGVGDTEFPFGSA